MTSAENRLLLKAIADETSYRIIRLLQGGERCACKIPEKIRRTQSNTSMHLAKLLKAGVLKARREGKMIIYSIKDQRVFALLRILGDTK